VRGAIIYLRVSSDELAGGPGLVRQREIVNAYRRDLRLVVVATLIDDGHSASKGEHLSVGKFGPLLREAGAGRHRGRVLVVEDLDRISRLGIDRTTEILRSFLNGGMEVHLAAERRVIRSLDDLMTVIFNAVKSFGAQEYARKISERVGAAWAAKKELARSGIPITRITPEWISVEGRIVQGSRVVAPGRFVLNEKARIVREAFRLAGLGLGLKKIASMLEGEASRVEWRRKRAPKSRLSWFTRTLSDRSVLGEYTPKGCAPISDYFPAVVSVAEFNAARDSLNGRRKGFTGGDSHSDKASNLFTGLLFDVTFGSPARTMSNQGSLRGRYLYTSFSSADSRVNRMRYALFEAAILSLLSDLPWSQIAGAAESDEVKLCRGSLDALLAEIDKVQRRIEVTNAAMDDGNVDVAAMRTLASRISRDEVALFGSLLERKTTLESSLASARGRSEALYDPAALFELIRNSKSGESNDFRLRLRTEIRKRVKRIELNFAAEILTAGPVPEDLLNALRGDYRQIMATVTFSNGAVEWAVIVGSKAILLRNASPGPEIRSIAS
jgi:DNA invertase Pin-like site-specific DNA recombinase